MKVTKCDRCGREFDRLPDFKIKIKKCGTHKYDLCDKCVNAIIWWFKHEVDK
jgi:hypothetical protein